jgi:hypothetical protein
LAEGVVEGMGGYSRARGGRVRLGEGWAYYLLQYVYFPCKFLYIENVTEEGDTYVTFFWFLIFLALK